MGPVMAKARGASPEVLAEKFHIRQGMGMLPTPGPGRAPLSFSPSWTNSRLPRDAGGGALLSGPWLQPRFLEPGPAGQHLPRMASVAWPSSQLGTLSSSFTQLIFPFSSAQPVSQSLLCLQASRDHLPRQEGGWGSGAENPCFPAEHCLSCFQSSE